VTTTPRHRVVVVGGGFGGLPATRVLAASDIDITLIDQRNHHLFQPLLYQVATGILSPGAISPVLRHTLRKRKNVTVVLSKVTGFDLERRVVHTAALPGEVNEFAYDSLIVAAGAEVPWRRRSSSFPGRSWRTRHGRSTTARRRQRQ